MIYLLKRILPERMYGMCRDDLTVGMGDYGKSVIGVSLMSVSVGDIIRTTTTNPEGGIGTFKPTMVNVDRDEIQNRLFYYKPLNVGSSMHDKQSIS